MRQLLTEKQVAQRLGLHVQTLRNWRFLGKGPSYVKIGAAVRYDSDTIDREIEKCTVNPCEK